MSGCRLKLVTVQTVPDRAFCARALLCAFRARHAYRERRGLLLHPLTGRFPRLQVSGAAGMRRLLPLPGQTDDTILAQAAAARGIGITALSPLHLARSPDRGLLLGFGRLPNHKIPAAVDAL
jgi:DNA-binding transcriptional MocR family regulator